MHQLQRWRTFQKIPDRYLSKEPIVLNTLPSARLNSWSEPREKTDFQTKFALFLLYSYYVLGKPFVYISFFLTALMLFDRRVLLDRVYEALTRRGYLSGFCWVLLLFTMHGIAGMVYGVVAGHKLVTALEVLAFNFCPWFVLIGVHAGVQRPLSARGYIRFLVWIHAILSPLYYLFFRHLAIGGSEGEFMAPGSGAMVLIGIFCFEKNLSRYWFPILVCSFDTIASEIRADWVGLAIALVIWAIATKQISRVVYAAGIMIALLAIGFAVDFRLPGLPGRGGEISARDTIGRALSSVAPEMAREYSTNSQAYAGTVQWRENWWKAIRGIVFEKPVTAVFGLGYGYPIQELVPYLKGGEIRSPHSVLYFTLAYSGLLGVLVFACLLASLLAVLWKTFKHTGQIFGFACLSFLIVCSLFGNLFESPQRSVPAFLLLGMCIGPLFLDREEEALAGRQRGSGNRVPAPYKHMGQPRQPTLARRDLTPRDIARVEYETAVRSAVLPRHHRT